MSVRSLVAARTPPTDDGRPYRPPLARTRWWSLRAGCAAACGGSAFLIAYAALQLAHAGGLDPRLVRALSPIPLFARAIAAGALATVGAAAGAMGEARLSRWLPRLLWFAAASCFLAVLVLA